MNTSTQAMNNVNKVQTPAVGNKPKQGQQESQLNFTELFSSALGQSAPTAQLNSIESQLRESLYQQSKPKKNNESTANAEAAQAAQAAVWAQRNWMQTAPVQQATPVAANEVIKDTKDTEAAKQAVAPDNTAPTDSANASTSSENSQANARGAQQTPEQNADNNTEQTAKVALPGNTTNPANSGAALDTIPTTTELALNSAADGEPVAQVINPTKPEQTTGNELAGADKARPDLKTTAQLKADATIANSTVQTRADTAQGNGPGNVGNAVQVQLNQQLNQQVAPQITQQMAQQAQAMGEGFGEEGLKVGQKILATGNLQSPGTATGLAAGTNGLTGSAGTAQQALIKTPVNQPGFAKELGQTVQWAIGKNLSTVDIRVNPESFGPMNMRLVQKGQQVQLVIRTQDEASANLLTQALGGLKEVLAQNGLQLNQVQIQHGNPSNQQGQPNNGQTQFDQNRNQGQGSGQHAGGGDNSQAESGAPTNTATARKPEGKLDLFA
ncbi:MAG: flagellar hook-length control protein FliK [Limnobacter sp.]|uniref:flagellar hook-length control protein FliK n=1 Tax=Limnobacter sp. TaxID=2003368 RepID=UPI0030029BBA